MYAHVGVMCLCVCLCDVYVRVAYVCVCGGDVGVGMKSVTGQLCERYDLTMEGLAWIQSI